MHCRRLQQVGSRWLDPLHCARRRPAMPVRRLHEELAVQHHVLRPSRRRTKVRGARLQQSRPRTDGVLCCPWRNDKVPGGQLQQDRCRQRSALSQPRGAGGRRDVAWHPRQEALLHRKHFAMPKGRQQSFAAACPHQAALACVSVARCRQPSPRLLPIRPHFCSASNFWRPKFLCMCCSPYVSWIGRRAVMPRPPPNSVHVRSWL